MGAIIPMKYLSLLALTLQNSLLTILLHYSRTGKNLYSAPVAVLLSEILKTIISFSIATIHHRTSSSISDSIKLNLSAIFSRDCWKLSIPAILYVIQNNLQFIAASNLDVATFSITYQLKILTTALCSVIILNRRLTISKWISLIFLALGVGLVQLSNVSVPASSEESRDQLTVSRSMNTSLGFMAVSLACLTSGLAGVYFELVLKSSSKVDLWIRNVQLSLFSLLPALFTVLVSLPPTSGSILNGFGVWAWATILTQVIGGLVTALVIKFADNILKGFATSLSIILSTLAGLFLFDAHLPFGSAIGASVVLFSTYTYNASSSSSASVGETVLPIAHSSNPKSSLFHDLKPPQLTINSKDHHLSFDEKKNFEMVDLMGLTTRQEEDEKVLLLSSFSPSPKSAKFPLSSFHSSSSSSSSSTTTSVHSPSHPQQGFHLVNK
ncbi:hypothetical protein H4Q26_006498 [Puccinia striiformis f. sp. tritici PST-130]|uniref:UDP-galactose transporter n=1 Tax=Puccinia striiformis f. sp. tritici PST-78 TaxID=1165861 RepID=A0A0L0V6W4_9BASI|nr:hypothetical protein Pst134EB_020676 [Puccinia striiformis f. sp. tritici]KAI9610359.1 hypothetical protein H4Q26_006498 [Puccinia striiformis f. sp. tritici PST-130]KNE95007.1 hypothetical protein PSTG_11704 [Puccinia striiformis f. sp. tritici PST-78]